MCISNISFISMRSAITATIVITILKWWRGCQEKKNTKKMHAQVKSGKDTATKYYVCKILYTLWNYCRDFAFVWRRCVLSGADSKTWRRQQVRFGRIVFVQCFVCLCELSATNWGFKFQSARTVITGCFSENVYFKYFLLIFYFCFN